MLCMSILCFVYLICSIRTNLIFFLIFFTLTPAFALLAGTFLQVANGQAALAGKLQEAAGAFTFVTCMLGWYIFLAIMLASVDFPLDLPRKPTNSLVISIAVLTMSSCRPFWRNKGCKREEEDQPRRVNATAWRKDLYVQTKRIASKGICEVLCVTRVPFVHRDLRMTSLCLLTEAMLGSFFRADILVPYQYQRF